MRMPLHGVERVVALYEAVPDSDRVALLEQAPHQEGSDISGAADYQDPAGAAPLFYSRFGRRAIPLDQRLEDPGGRNSHTGQHDEGNRYAAADGGFAEQQDVGCEEEQSGERGVP